NENEEDMYSHFRDTTLEGGTPEANGGRDFPLPPPPRRDGSPAKKEIPCWQKIPSNRFNARFVHESGTQCPSLTPSPLPKPLRDAAPPRATKSAPRPSACAALAPSCAAS